MKIKMLVKVIVLGTVITTVSTTVLAEPSIQELVELIKSMQMEMDGLKQQLNNTASRQEVQIIKREVATASEWTQPDTLTHMAGYADVGYTDSESADGSFNTGSFAPIFHYQYRDIVMLEAELEFKTEDDGETETTLEYLTIDWFINDYMTLIGGKFLSPIGQFRQNLHPSWINKMASAPPGFGHDGAAPVSDLGFQLRGGFPIGNVRLIKSDSELLSNIINGYQSPGGMMPMPPRGGNSQLSSADLAAVLTYIRETFGD